MKPNKIYFVGFEEEWKTVKIKGEKTKYQVSNLGQVRNTKRNNKILATTNDRYGYTQICLSHKNKKYVKTMHRLVAETFIDNPKNLPEVNHKDGKKYNNSIYNLEWVTTKENIIHAYKSGLHDNVAIGEKHGQNKYKEKMIHKVCKYLEENKLSLNEISEKTGIKKSTIHDIIAKKYWRHISKDYKIENYTRNKDKFDIPYKERVKELAKQYHTTDEVRKAMNITQYDERLNSIIYYYVKKYNKIKE